MRKSSIFWPKRDGLLCRIGEQDRPECSPLNEQQGGQMVIGTQQVRQASAAWPCVPVSRRLLLRNIGHVDRGFGRNAGYNRSQVGEVPSMFNPDIRYYRDPYDEQPYQSGRKYRADLRRQRRWL